MSSAGQPRLSSTVALIGSLSAGYAISQFLRGSVGVIAPDLARELDLDAAELGLLSSAFFASFAAAQIPLGVAIDRFGPKLCLVVSMTLAVAGAVAFALAESPTGLVLARVLLGLGCSCLFMGPLAIFARWFSLERFSTVTGILFALGNVGTLLAAAPLAIAAQVFGWRGAFLGVAAITLGALVLIALVAREAPPGSPWPQSRHRGLREAFAGISQVVRMRSVGRLFAMHLASYSVFATVFGLWAGPWLADVYGMGLGERGNLLLLLALAQIVGVACWGPSDRLCASYKTPVLVGAALTIIVLLVPVLMDLASAAAIGLWFAALGLCGAYTSVLTAHGRSLFPPEFVGRGLTLLNLGTMAGVFLQQILTGWLIALFPSEMVDGRAVYPATAYQAVFALLAVCLAAALAIYRKARDPAAEGA